MSSHGTAFVDNNRITNGWWIRPTQEVTGSDIEGGPCGVGMGSLAGRLDSCGVRYMALMQTLFLVRHRGDLDN